MSGPILVTGGTGMVGRNVRDAAAARGVAVVAPPRSELDLQDERRTRAFISELQPSVIVHAAGRVGGIEANMREPVAFLTENLDIGRNVVLSARAAGVKRLINLGSSCMYPKDSPRPLTENDILSGPLEPTNEAYAIAKIAVQRLCDYVRTENPEYQYKTLIPCNLYGRYDAFDPRRSHLAAAVIPKLHHAKLANRPTVEIWGDGTARREFLYAGDLADAIISAIERFDTLPPVMNVGAGLDHSVNDYYRIAAEVIGYRGSFVHDLSRPVGMKRKLMDVSLAQAWGWSPQTSLKDGLAKSYEHYVEAVADVAH
ncbi:GDP-L-fucose synthase [soil metagenome]